MRILYYSPAYWVDGGAGSHAQGLVAGWIELGHEVTVLPPRPMGTPSESSIVGSRRSFPQAVMSIARTARGLARATLLIWKCMATLRSLCPDVTVVRRAPYDFLADALSRSSSGRVIGEVNAIGSFEAEAHWGHRYDIFERRREKAFLHRCSRVACVTEEVRAQVLDLGISGERTLVVPNGVDTRLFRPNVARQATLTGTRTEADVFIAYCASVSPLHDLSTAVEAMALLRALTTKRISYIFAGPDADDLVAAGADLDLIDSCAHIGPIPHAAVPGLLAHAHLGCVALRNSYGSPLKIMEFMAMGIPVVVAASGSGLDPLRASGGGFVCAPGDARALAQTLATLVEDDSLRSKVGSRASAWVAANGSWKHMAERMLTDA